MRYIFASLVAIVFIANSAPVQAEVRTQRIVSGLDQPLFVTSDPLESDRLLIVEKGGLIKVFDRSTDTLLGTPFLDLTSEISTVGEQGVLGLAYHPDYMTNGWVYVNYTDTSGNLQVSRYNVFGDGLSADPTSSMSVINIPQSSASHNGGWIGFDPSSTDPNLYIAVGDDGIGYVEDGGVVTLQNRETLNGAIVRINVDSDDFPGSMVDNYAIPTDNPFYDPMATDNVRQEIWGYGLRNPWRPSFDSSNGDLYIADVGENTREEINFLAALGDMETAEASNFAWPHREGNAANPDATDPNAPAMSIGPILDYAHGDGQFEGQSVTGGYVYRGDDEATHGQYFFGDFVTGKIYSIDVSDGSPSPQTRADTDWTTLIAPLEGSIDSIASFGEAADGTMFIVDYDGEIYSVDPVADEVTTASFVDGLYDRVLGRSGETMGRQHWIDQLTPDGMGDTEMTRNDVAMAFWDSPEHARMRVNALYNQYLRRPADAEGRDGKVEQIVNEGASDTDIAVAMLTSLEFHREHLSDSAFVIAVFERAHGRQPTSQELSARFFQLQGGTARSVVAEAIIDTQEGNFNVVENLYDKLLEREADFGGSVHFTNQISMDSMTPSEVAAALSSSQEFVYGVLRDAEFGDGMMSLSAFSEAFAAAALESVPHSPQPVGGAAAVPEPGAFALVALGLACLAGGSRRRR